MFPSQPQNNLEFIYEVVVQDKDLPNMVKDESMIGLGNDEKTNQPTPRPLDEKLDAKNFEKHKEGKTYDKEAKVDTPMELENGLTTLDDEKPKKMSIIEISIEYHCNRAIQDAPYIEELIEYENILPLAIYDDLPLKKMGEPLKPILKLCLVG